MNKEIAMILIEDNPAFRKVVAFTLADEPGMNLVDSYGTAEAAVRDLEARIIRPEIILLDINLPGESGVEVIPKLRALCPETKIIMLTQSDKESDVLQAIQSGAAGYVLKSGSVDNITESIRCVHRGEAALDASVAKYLVKALHARKPTVQLQVSLSTREKEVLVLMSKGLSKKQMADEMKIGTHTVGDYVKKIYHKLEVQNAPGAVSQAYRKGLLSPDE